jgi:hypothetical protein
MKVFNKQLSGLGNQLFQYAAGVYFAERYGAQLVLLPEPVEGTLSHGVYRRPFLLSKFALTATVQEKGRLDAQMLTATPRFPGLRKAVQTLSGIAVRQESVEQRYRFLNDLGLQAGVRSLYLAGYWQAYGYAEAVATRLRKDLVLHEPASGHNQRVLEQIKGASVPVSLHIRRGDYTLTAEGNIALPLDYYERAINLVRQRFEDPVFFIFSDDLDFARRHLSTGGRQVFVEGNDDFSSYEDLRLMAACKHHIIANSSFSWWGAWLNPDQKKFVAAPRHWHLSPDSVYEDLLPPTWHAIDSLRSGNM